MIKSTLEMIVLAIDRSTDVQSAALAVDGKVVAARVFPESDARSADWPIRVREFLSESGKSFDDVDEYLVGQGPGSFAGIRAALAFAQGLALPAGKKVYGLPSAAALALPQGVTAVIGDARRDRYWIVVYEGVEKVHDFILSAREDIVKNVPGDAVVTTSDGARIGPLLSSLFADRYKGSLTPLASALLEAAIKSPQARVLEPLPVYLSPAVRQS